MLTMYRGDLKPDLVVALTDGDGNAVDLTTASQIRVIGALSCEVIFDRSPSFVDAAGGVVTMLWEPADTAAVGTLRVEVEVTWPGVKPQTFRPNEPIRIEQDYA